MMFPFFHLFFATRNGAESQSTCFSSNVYGADAFLLIRAWSDHSPEYPAAIRSLPSSLPDTEGTLLT